MKQLVLSFLTILFFLTTSVVLGETLDKGYLVERNGLLYKHFSSVPFTGKVTGGWSGKLVDGKKFGNWKTYWLNGNLASEGKYIEGGIKSGVWKHYDANGNLISKHTYVAHESLREKAKGD